MFAKNRANRCLPKPLKALQEVLLDHLRHNTSAHTAICERPQLFDIVVGCGDHANATIENWAKGLCFASSWRGGFLQSRTRRRTSSLLGTKSNSVATRKSGAKSSSRRRPHSNNDKFDKQMKRINSLLNKAKCKPRKMLLPVSEAAWLTNEQRTHFTERVHLEPCMIEVKRCGGCCANELLECSPVKTKNKTIPVLKLESSGREVRSSNRNSEDLIEELSVEFHTKCKCECKIKKCPPTQVFDEETCTCGCRNSASQQSCPSQQFFDFEECRCRCHRNRECSSGMVFDTSTCRCEVQDMFYAEYVLL
ncbi:PDGF/VEGF domain [Trinorchestia longiramus]|nr:PDGF/VEGF domain [Trinorchestia longiramus]